MSRVVDPHYHVQFEAASTVYFTLVSSNPPISSHCVLHAASRDPAGMSVALTLPWLNNPDILDIVQRRLRA
jgi:hypothetical protein